MVRDGLISRQEFLTFYGKVLQNSDDDAFEKGIERFYSSSKIVTNEKIDNLKNDKLDAGLTQFKMFFKRMQNSTFVNHLRVWRTNMAREPANAFRRQHEQQCAVGAASCALLLLCVCLRPALHSHQHL